MKIDLETLKNSLSKTFLTFKGYDKAVIDTLRIVTDTRKIKTGDVFWPIKGDNFDGHDFIEDALNKGAKGFITEKNEQSGINERLKNENIFYIRVSDSLAALQNLATYVRKKSSCKVIGITGSNGKTTTKDLITTVLSQSHNVISSPKSFNNHIGVPLTLITIDEKTEYAVVEMGMNHKGELLKIMEMSIPDIGIVLNASEAHMGNFENFEEIVAAKGEMVEAISENAILIVNENLLKYHPFCSHLKSGIKIFGKENCDAVIKNAFQDKNNLKVTLEINNDSKTFIYPGLGINNAENIAASVLCFNLLGIEYQEIHSGFANFSTPPMRMEPVITPGGILVINDAYNANPVSFKNAIEVLDSIKCSGSKYLVVGDMLELGKYSEQKHIELGVQLCRGSVNYVYSIGQFSALVSNEVNEVKDKTGIHFKDKNSLSKTLKAQLTKNDVLLLKGSRLNRLESILQKLLENQEE